MCRRRPTQRRSTMADANSERLDLGGALHQPGEVVGDDLVRDRGLQRVHDVGGGVVPADVLEHEHAREQHRAGVHLVLAGVLGRRAVRGLEDAMAGHVVDVGPRGDADATDLGGQRVGEVVAVEVGRGDDVEVRGPGQHLLQRDVGDGVLDQQLVAGLAVAVVPADGDVGELLADELVAPLAERALGELLDVALVHERDRAALAVEGVADGGADEALGAHLRDGLDADARAVADGPAHFGRAGSR